jgi:hypothetical protein
MYALIENSAVKRYPYTATDFRRDNPDISFPDALEDTLLQSFGVWRVQDSKPPSYDKRSQKLVEGTPVFSIANQCWTQVWSVRPLTREEMAQKVKGIQDEIVNATQQRLDTFAQIRGYDNILSLCTYVSSPNEKFKAEGQYGVEARDATWSRIYKIFTDVQSGVRPLPNSYADIDSDLPPLIWPTSSNAG